MGAGLTRPAMTTKSYLLRGNFTGFQIGSLYLVLFSHLTLSLILLFRFVLEPTLNVTFLLAFPETNSFSGFLRNLFFIFNVLVWTWAWVGTFILLEFFEFPENVVWCLVLI